MPPRTLGGVSRDMIRVRFTGPARGPAGPGGGPDPSRPLGEAYATLLQEEAGDTAYGPVWRNGRRGYPRELAPRRWFQSPYRSFCRELLKRDFWGDVSKHFDGWFLEGSGRRLEPSSGDR